MAIGTVLEIWNLWWAQSKNEVWKVSASYENNHDRKWKFFGEILHASEVMIHGVSKVDLDWAEVIGIA